MKIEYKYAQLISDRVNPNTYIVLTMRQGLPMYNGAFIPPTEQNIDRVIKAFLRHLAILLYGRRTTRRNRLRIPNISTLEGRRGTLWHVNICLRRPFGVSVESLRLKIEQAWRRSRWALPDFYVEEIKGDAVPYILKEGTDALLTESTHFDFNCSAASTFKGIQSRQAILAKGLDDSSALATPMH